MAVYVLDTGILISILRAGKGNSAAAERDLEVLESKFDLLGGQHNLVVSIVSYAEIMAFTHYHNWKKEHVQNLEHALRSKIAIIDIMRRYDELLGDYVRIDNYSRDGKNKHAKKSGTVIMGKHDIWIAATALNLEAELITYDQDFRHLPPELLTVHILERPPAIQS